MHSVSLWVSLSLSRSLSLSLAAMGLLAASIRCGAVRQSYMSCAHIYRMVVDYGGWTIDFTTPQVQGLGYRV